MTTYRLAILNPPRVEGGDAGRNDALLTVGEMVPQHTVITL